MALSAVPCSAGDVQIFKEEPDNLKTTQYYLLIGKFMNYHTANIYNHVSLIYFVVFTYLHEHECLSDEDHTILV